MITPTPGIVYKFKFDDGFTAMDGTYKLVQLMTYDEYLEQGHDLVTDFYAVCGKEEADLNKDIEMIRQSKIMKLVAPDDFDTEVVRFAPFAYLKQNPDHNVKKYHKLGMIAYIGITDDPKTLDYVLDNVKQNWEAALGLTPDPRFMSTGEVYLTQDEYQEILAERNDDMKKVINYFSENRRLQTQLSQSKTRLAAYEQVIENLVKQVRDLTELVNADGGE